MPATGVLAREVIEFQAKGVPEVEAAIDVLMKTLDGVQKVAAKVQEVIAAGFQQAKPAADSYAQAVKKAQDETRALSQALGSGAYQAMANKLAAIGKEMEGLQKQARWQDLVAQQGKFGASLTVISEKLAGATKGLEALGAKATIAFAAMSAGIGGWVRAGLQGTGIGNYLQLQFSQLSKEIAGVFLPTVQRVVSGVQAVTSWFRSLTGAQQDNIRRWAEAAVVAAGVVALLPRLVAGINTVIGALRALTAATASTGWGAVLVAVGLVAGALAGLVTATESGRNAFSKLWGALQPIIGHMMEAWSKLATPLLEAFEKAAPAVVGVLQTVVEQIISVCQSFMEPMLAVAKVFFSAFMSLVPAIAPLVEVLGQLWRVALLPVIGEMTALAVVAKLLASVLGPILGAALNLIAGLLRPLFGLFDTLMTAFAPLMEVVSSLGDVLGALAKVLAALLAAVLEPLVRLFAVAVGIVALCARAFLAVLVPALQVATLALKGVAAMLEGLAFIISLPMKALDALATLVQKVGGFFGESFAPAGEIVGKLGTIFDLLKQAAEPVLWIVGAIGKAFAAVAQVISTLVVGAFKILAGVLGDILKPVFSVIGGILDAIIGTLKSAVAAIRDTVMGIIHFVEAVFQLVVAKLADYIEKAANLLDKIPGAGETAKKLHEVAGDIRNIKFDFGPDEQKDAGKDKPHRRPAEAGGNFEAIQETFKRLQSAAIKSTDPEKAEKAEEKKDRKEQLKNTEAMRKALEEWLKRKGLGP